MNQLINSSDANVKKQFKLDRVYAKASFVGRKLMLDIRSSVDRLETILCFFKVSVELFEHVYPHGPDSDGLTDESPLKKSIEHILNLTQRLATDQQYAKHEKVRQTSIEIQDQLQQFLSTPVYLQIYNSIQKQILRRRAERKENEKRLVMSEKGLQVRQRKRDRKMEKKREKKVRKIVESKLK